jgi:hypothetical protein
MICLIDHDRTGDDPKRSASNPQPKERALEL